MEITKETLTERIKNLETQREQLVANINAVNGAIGTLQQLVKDLDNVEPEIEDAPNLEG